MESCIFCKIATGEIPAGKVYEDELTVAFRDIHPQAPVHFLLIPKSHIASLAECTATEEKVLGRMLALAPKLALQQGANDGFRTIINTGRVGGQEVYHLHVHVIGGPDPLGRMLGPV